MPEPGDAAAAGQRRIEHLRRSRRGADGGDPADPLPHAVAAAGPRRRAGASHELISHLLSLSSRRRTVLFTCGWAITEADEQAIRLLPAAAWKAAVDQDGAVQEDKHVAEITHLLSRAASWPDGLRWIVRRTRPSRRQAKNLTAFERATGWRYSIIVTNIPAAGGVPGVPGSHHAQFTDVLHREHAIVEDQVSACDELTQLGSGVSCGGLRV